MHMRNHKAYFCVTSLCLILFVVPPFIKNPIICDTAIQTMFDAAAFAAPSTGDSTAKNESAQPAELKLAEPLTEEASVKDTNQGFTSDPGRLQIGGKFSLSADYFTGHPEKFQGQTSSENEKKEDDKTSSGARRPGFTQDLELNLLAQTGPRSDIYVSLASQGVWGVQFPSDGSYGMNPTFGPLLIDEVNFRYVGKRFSVTAGRLYASMGPVGLLCKSTVSPFEGILATGKVTPTINVSLLYSRLSSQYGRASNIVVGSDDLIALRAEMLAGDWSLGYNYLFSGLVDERGQSIDFIGRILGRKVKGEVAFMRPPTTFGPEFNKGWVTGWAITTDVFDSDKHHLSITAGWLPPGFEPTFSASQSAGGTELGLYENTKGIRVSYERRLSPKTMIHGTATYLAFNNPEDAKTKGLYEKIPTLSYTMGVTRELSPSSEIGLDYSAYQNSSSGYGRIKVFYNVLF